MKLTRKLNNLVVCSSLLLLLVALFPWVSLEAQVTNGVFDPSKARNQERAQELKQIEANIKAAHKFNKTIGVPELPASHSSNTVVPSAVGHPYEVQHSGSPPKRRPGRGFPPIEGVRVVDESVPTFAPVQSAPTFARAERAPVAPTGTVPNFVPPTESVPNFASESLPNFAPPRSRNSPLSFIKRALGSVPQSNLQSRRVEEGNFDEVNFTAPVLETTEIGNTSPPSQPLETARLTQLETKLQQLEDTIATLQTNPSGIELPATEGRIPRTLPRSNPFSRLFKQRSRTLDLPPEPIPIDIGRGNPFDPSFRAGPERSSLFDIQPREEESLVDSTDGVQLPEGGGGFSADLLPPPGPTAGNDDISQYWVVTKEGSIFIPYRPGTSIPENADAGMPMWSGSVVKSFGLVNGNRKIQVDFGDTGIISAGALRALTTAEKAEMKAGIAAGNLWYDILDTEPTL